MTAHASFYSMTAHASFNSMTAHASLMVLPVPLDVHPAANYAASQMGDGFGLHIGPVIEKLGPHDSLGFIPVGKTVMDETPKGKHKPYFGFLS
jgi:hypothetical protein